MVTDYEYGTFLNFKIYYDTVSAEFDLVNQKWTGFKVSVVPLTKNYLLLAQLQQKLYI